MAIDIHDGRRAQGRLVRGFTIIEILVVVAIIALLLSILLPALGRARMQAKMVACKANLGGIGRAFATYTEEYKGVYPHQYLWYSSPKYWEGVMPDNVGPEHFLGIAGWTINGQTIGANTYGPGQLFKYVKSVESFTCPQDVSDSLRPWGLNNRTPTSQPPPGTGSYSMMKDLWDLDTNPSNGLGDDKHGWYTQRILLQTPSRVLLLFEQREDGHFNDMSGNYLYTPDICDGSLNDNDWGSQAQKNGDGGLAKRHGGMGCFLFYDSHVEHRRSEEQFNAGRRIVSVKTGQLFDKVYADHATGTFRYRQAVKKCPENPRHSIMW